ncbi:hypothetical protein L5515_009472 [Caenorhabditis briggsae]|uniref:DUF38 domain-containing protein n=1 Tax=Caenorhabditis briggsae TaxID=6238 RepID=A0AAE9JQ20_CAEBR|nr:hypothetical protein L5515_009472 [Caenorhabditis briggsae]
MIRSCRIRNSKKLNLYLTRIAFELVESKKSPNLILYSKAQRSFHGKTEFFGYRNIVNVAVRDLELVLKFQKSILKRLYLEFDNVQLYGGSLVHTVPIKLSNMFEKLNRNVKTRTLSIKTNDPSQIMRILKFVDPGTLKIIELSSLDDQMEIEIDEFVKTEQWKKAEGMHCGFDVLNLNVKDICHFSSCSIRTSSITAQELGLLKKTFSSSSKLEYCRLGLRTFNEEMSNLWGPANIFGSRSTWYFQMENSDDKILRIETDQIPQEHLPQKIVKFDMVDIST